MTLWNWYHYVLNSATDFDNYLLWLHRPYTYNDWFYNRIDIFIKCEALHPPTPTRPRISFTLKFNIQCTSVLIFHVATEVRVDFMFLYIISVCHMSSLLNYTFFLSVRICKPCFLMLSSCISWLRILAKIKSQQYNQQYAYCSFCIDIAVVSHIHI